ncbi:MAG: NifB/NifX family molybdenum-iron cluster-binding protein [Victivallaceae bacterium]|nr:NifB/NifX family molybdenum-iron cluster-binding protein [Victivallaceae bacterium]MDD4181292.1 NifB/NifX family molybdenum-iron cluster-binding protein [Victivallaceae bacterium]
MKLALTICRERIAPVFDVSGQALILEISDGQIINELSVALPLESPEAKVEFLLNSGVNELICGAIFCQTQMLAEKQDIKVYAFIAGDYSEVIKAWQEEKLELGDFAMPGCRRDQRQCRRRGRRMRSN